MDELDQAILGLLSGDARITLSTMARRLKVARSTVQARLERLETSGVIAGYTVKLGEAARAGRLRATVLLEIELRQQPAILGRLKTIPEVERISTTVRPRVCVPAVSTAIWAGVNSTRSGRTKAAAAAGS